MLFYRMGSIFDHEKLDIYGLELQFVTWTTDFLDEVSQSPVSRRRGLVDQLDRASISVLLNTAARLPSRPRQGSSPLGRTFVLFTLIEKCFMYETDELSRFSPAGVCTRFA
jgi:hypothetical protein